MLHGNLFDMHLNIASSLLLQSGDHETKYLFFTCLQFCKNVTIRADFELYVNPEDAIRQNLFVLLGIRQMPLHKCRTAI